MRSININNYNLPADKEWQRSLVQTEFHGDEGEYYIIVDKKTPAGFSITKQTADAVSEMAWSANNNLACAISMLITTYPADDKKSAEILKRAEQLREAVWGLKQDIDRDLRGLTD